MFAIIEKLGGWPKVQPLLAARSLTASDMAYYQWRSRRRLPVSVRLALELEARAANIRIREADFIRA